MRLVLRSRLPIFFLIHHCFQAAAEALAQAQAQQMQQMHAAYYGLPPGGNPYLGSPNSMMGANPMMGMGIFFANM